MSDCNICRGDLTAPGTHRCEVLVCHNELNRIRAEVKKWEQAAKQRSQCVKELLEKLDEVRKELETSHCQVQSFQDLYTRWQSGEIEEDTYVDEMDKLWAQPGNEECRKCSHSRSEHTSGGGCIMCHRRDLPSCTYERRDTNDTHTTDYRELLRKYMDHVGECEGVTFLSQAYKMTSFSEEEKRELRSINEGSGKY